jgi:hypothetical protein
MESVDDVGGGSGPGGDDDGRVAGGEGTLELLAYQVAVRDLDRQEAVLNELRARAGTVLTASSIVASFLGSQAIQQAGFGVTTWLALVAFVTSVVLCVWILTPRPTLTFALNAPGIYEALYDQGENMPEVHRRLAYWIGGFYNANQTRLDPLTRVYQLAAGAVVAESILWVIDFRFGL